MTPHSPHTRSALTCQLPQLAKGSPARSTIWRPLGLHSSIWLAGTFIPLVTQQTHAENSLGWKHKPHSFLERPETSAATR